MPTPAPSTPWSGLHGATLELLEREQEVGDGRGETRAEQAARLVSLEGRLQRLVHDLDVPPEDGRDPLACVAAACRAQARRWAPAAEPLAEGLLAQRLGALATFLGGPGPTGSPGAVSEPAQTPRDAMACLASLAALEREALTLDAPLALTQDAFRERREAHRAALLGALARTAAEPHVRARWVRDLRDRAAGARTGLDDLAPAQACAHLERVADDLHWHAEHVEPRRSRGARSLRRAERRLRAAGQERALEARLASRFGARRAAQWERLVVGAILAVLALLVVETTIDLPTWARLVGVGVDTLACGVLLTDFFVRLAHVRPGRGRWFLRNVWLGLLPSLPLSWLSLAHVGGEPLHAGVGLRVFQLPRFARTLRFLLPLLRLLRVVGFLVRGLDRLARAYGRLLDYDVILHPNREERASVRRRAEAVPQRAGALAAALDDDWQELLAAASPEERPALLAVRVEGLAACIAAAGPRPRPASPGGGVEPTREITGELLLERWASATPGSVSARLEPELLARLAAALRVLCRWPLSWMPFVRRYLPRLAPAMGDADVVALAARTASAELARHHRRWQWFADLYGTLTPAEFVDRLGTALVKSSFRPAYRLTLFGAIYLLVSLLVGLIGGAFLQGLLHTLNPFVTDTLVLLGAICFAILALGWWMRRVASQSTAFYEALSGAQFLELMETLKGRGLARDAALFERRVLRPEALLTSPEAGAEASSRTRARDLEERVRAWLVEPQGRGGVPSTFDAAGRVALLWRDALDGALFLESDARTSRQFLGSPVLGALRRRSTRVGKAERKELAALDLNQPRSSLRGPYLWFSFLSQAVIQTVGRLLADYNRSVLPLAELAVASTEERARHASWVSARHGALAAAGHDEVPSDDSLEHASGEFMALHFLDDDPLRDREVQERYGPAVLGHLRADRRFLVRRIFGTYPLHLRARAQRTLNLRRLYDTWLGNGRALLLPLRLVWRGLAFGGLLVRWVIRALNEVRKPQLRAAAEEAAQADFATALRKIDRVRGPLADACLWLRARADAEYLGLSVSGVRTSQAAGAPVAEDLAFLGRRATLAARVDQERQRARADLERLDALAAGGLWVRLAARLGVEPETLTPEHRRALTLAYRMDVDGVRTLLSAAQIAHEVMSGAQGRALAPRSPLFRWRRHRAFRSWWGQHGGEPAVRRQAWRAAAHDVEGVGRALDLLARTSPEEARARGEAVAADLVRHPGRLTETLVTLRAVQTLSLLDVLTYREHVYRLGRYAESGDAPGSWLTLVPEPAIPTVG